MSKINILPFTKEHKNHMADAAKLLIEAFPHSYGDCANEEVEKCFEDNRIAFMAIEDDKLIGFAGAIPQYGVTGWELHPLVVKRAYRHNGIGSMLVAALEREVAKRGGITIYLGSDDESGSTSLSNTDLYQDTFRKIESIENLAHHPFEFYSKIGYKIVGVIPDANGIGKPDIWMAKRIVNN